MAKRKYSDCSTKISRLGRDRMIWRQSSLPTEPPAPVTNTFLLRSERPINNSLGATASRPSRSEEHTFELQSLMRISSAVFCLKKKSSQTVTNHNKTH